jgi:hypothetical protein
MLGSGLLINGALSGFPPDRRFFSTRFPQAEPLVSLISDAELGIWAARTFFLVDVLLPHGMLSRLIGRATSPSPVAIAVLPRETLRLLVVKRV